MEGDQQQLALEGHHDADSSFLFALEELRNLRPQLLTAADYCEQQYLTSGQKETVSANLQDYAVKALVNVVDHLGTVAYKLNLCLEQEASRTSASDLHIMALQQRLACIRTYMEQDAAKQQQQPKAGQRMVKQYRVQDATAEAAFEAAQRSPEMPREVFEREERGWSEAAQTMNALIQQSDSPVIGGPRSERAATSQGPRRRKSMSKYPSRDSPSSPFSDTGEPVWPAKSSTAAHWRRSITPNRPESARITRRLSSDSVRASESPDVSSPVARPVRSGSTFKRIFSGLISRKPSA